MPPATDMQQMEVDMIEGMYPDHCTSISSDPPCFAVTFSATPEDAQELRVQVTFPDERYPEEGSPAILIENISKDRRFPVHLLQEELEVMAQTNLGMHVVVLMLQRSQEWLTTIVEEEEKASMQKNGDAVAAAAAIHHASVDPTIRMGNAITRDLFEAWRQRHMEEKRLRRAEEARRTHKELASKLTGRQLWDSTIRNADWELFGAAEDDADVDLDDAAFDYEFGEDEDEDGEDRYRSDDDN